MAGNDADEGVDMILIYGITRGGKRQGSITPLLRVEGLRNL